MTQLPIAVAQSTQTAIPELKKEATTLNYLIIGEGDDKIVINIGTKTYEKVNSLINKPEKNKNAMDNKTQVR